MASWGRRGSYAHVYDDGVALCARDKALRRLLPWPELLEWRKEFTHPISTYTATMKSGEEVHVDFIADDALPDALESHGIPLTADPMCRPTPHGRRGESPWA